jgi:hypothetical protein
MHGGAARAQSMQPRAARAAPGAGDRGAARERVPLPAGPGRGDASRIRAMTGFHEVIIPGR